MKKRDMIEIKNGVKGDSKKWWWLLS